MMELDQNSRVDEIQSEVLRFVNWLDRYGEVSFDHQSYFAGDFGGQPRPFTIRNLCSAHWPWLP